MSFLPRPSSLLLTGLLTASLLPLGAGGASAVPAPQASAASCTREGRALVSNHRTAAARYGALRASRARLPYLTYRLEVTSLTPAEEKAFEREVPRLQEEVKTLPAREAFALKRAGDRQQALTACRGVGGAWTRERSALLGTLQEEASYLRKQLTVTEGQRRRAEVAFASYRGRPEVEDRVVADGAYRASALRGREAFFKQALLLNQRSREVLLKTS